MKSHNTLFALRNISTTELKTVIKSFLLLCKQIFSAIDGIYNVHTCFLVRVLPVLSLMYLAISSLRPEKKESFCKFHSDQKVATTAMQEKHASLNNTGRIHETETTHRKTNKVKLLALYTRFDIIFSIQCLLIFHSSSIQMLKEK